MGIIDDKWKERSEADTNGNPIKEISSALMEMWKESYIAGWIDCDKTRQKKSEEKLNSAGKEKAVSPAGKPTDQSDVIKPCLNNECPNNFVGDVDECNCLSFFPAKLVNCSNYRA